MNGKTLTRADLAEAVVEKVGLPRNENKPSGPRICEIWTEHVAHGVWRCKRPSCKPCDASDGLSDV